MTMFLAFVGIGFICLCFGVLLLWLNELLERHRWRRR